MKNLGTLSGHGSLVVDRMNFGDVGYTIFVRQTKRKVVSADGLLNGPSGAFTTGQTAKLILKDGCYVEVVFTHIVGRAARVVVNGPVPGYSGTA